MTSTRIMNASGKPRPAKRVCAVVALCVAAAIAVQAQTLTTLFSFDNADGVEPNGGLLQANDGNLYGTTYFGGANDRGKVFKITPGGTLTKLYSFCSQGGVDCTDGLSPAGGLIQGVDGNLYGTTGFGGAVNANCPSGALGCGTVFQITPSGTLTTLYSFCSQGGVDCTDGLDPTAPLVQAADGDFYGTTANGGANNGGTVFKITPAGTLTTLYSFCSQGGVNCTDGGSPGGLVQVADGDFYGTTGAGGVRHAGTVFKITQTGTLTTLYSFHGVPLPNGGTAGPIAPGGIFQAEDGDLYGITGYGGVSGKVNGCYFENGCGTVFKITPSGTLTTLYKFCSQSGCTDGAAPTGLIQASNGNFYGATLDGGASCAKCGTVFEITPTGTLTTLYSFDSVDGKNPYSLVQDTSGNFYGPTGFGGANACPPFTGCGTIFSLSVGLDPFVETRPAFGKAGATIEILGTNLTGSTSVTFNGISASFTVVSPSRITVTVPAGATAGAVQVVTPDGTLSSNTTFRVPK